MAQMINGLFPGELTPTKTVAGCMDIFENVWPNPAETIKMLDAVTATPESGVYRQRAPTIGDREFQNQRTNKQMGITHLAQVTNNGVLQNIHNQFNLMLIAASVPYANRYGIQGGLWHEEYNALKYSGGEEYTAHYDGDTITGRSISALLYLNSEFEGGHTEFPHFDITLTPSPGTLVLFPSNFAYRHIAHPVTSGTKYALVTWIKDREL